MNDSNQHHRLGDLQLRILQALWERGECGVAEVHAALQTERKLAHTTISTMLRKMEARGLVAHREEGRAFVYEPVVIQEEASRKALGHLVNRFFGGSCELLVVNLLKQETIGRAELRRIKKMITESELGGKK